MVSELKKNGEIAKQMQDWKGTKKRGKLRRIRGQSLKKRNERGSSG